MSNKANEKHAGWYDPADGKGALPTRTTPRADPSLPVTVAFGQLEPGVFGPSDHRPMLIAPEHFDYYCAVRPSQVLSNGFRDRSWLGGLVPMKGLGPDE